MAFRPRGGLLTARLFEGCSTRSIPHPLTWAAAIAVAVAAGLASAPVSAARSTAHHACADPQPGFPSCLAVVSDLPSPQVATTAPSGYTPQQIQAAYELPVSSGGALQTVAVVDAYDDPVAESDLSAYRALFGLPPCTSAAGCLRKIDQRGGTTYPTANAGWSYEISLDLDMVSAACPLCHIILVEADDNSWANLTAAEDEAASLHPVAISNSYGAPEFAGETALEPHYDHPGIAITVGSGDSGYGVEYPASSQLVTAVGGTSLSVDASARGFAESAWSGSGSGCSAYIAKPAWQHDTGCAMRTVADVAAVADPATGVLVYDSYGRPSLTTGNLSVAGGTSVGAPIVAAVFALAGAAGSTPEAPYQSPSRLWDVTSGSNGSCSPSYLCTAGPGYDGPTGLGTPMGALAFGWQPTSAAPVVQGRPATLLPILGTPRAGATPPARQ